MKGKVIRRAGVITRPDLQAAPETLFVFGDNMQRRGFGGQAAAMRGEPNAVGIPTKWRPARYEEAYFTDAVIYNKEVRQAIREAFDVLRRGLKAGRDVVIPADGIGTGRARLPETAPRLFAVIEAGIRELEEF